MYKICFYVPPTHIEEVKHAMFAKGAGKVGDYSHCAWQILGEGQFLPLAGSDPFIGKLNQEEKISEYKVEIVCEDQYIHAVLAALKQSHPYEEPAYQVMRLESL
ncbi:MAG: NGG1p interacting factor NIF3 [Gammaproteobacteria bacterium RIFCSPHIGHO2_12_FULL_37_14]|nr:MAG: NGG1p interacting factor NIF3 [Gammaproteobacteria bacterium RIFCSPHIGHO2_12_FULL_37_14]